MRDKFDWDGYRLHFAEIELRKIVRCVSPKQRLDIITEDPPDNRILECALEAGSDFILTWDKDLLRRGEFGIIKIVRPVEFLQRESGF